MTSDTYTKEQEKLNELVKDYDDFSFDKLMRAYMKRELMPFLPAGKALEIGCMHGEFTEILCDLYQDVTVVEAANGFIETARSRVGKRAKFVNALIESYQTDERYDAIFLIHVMEHLIDPVQVLNTAKNFLTENGRLFLIVPNGNAPSRQIAVKMNIISTLSSLTKADIKHGHRRVYFLDNLQREAKDAGLNVIHSGGIFFKALANFQYDGLMTGPYITPEYMEGCYQLGKEYPHLCASIYCICER